MEVKMDLKNLQFLFKQLITDFDLSQLPAGFFATGTGRLTAQERLAIYRKDFGSRFVEVLQETYPNLHILLGEEEFADLAQRYTSQYPSRHYDLNHLGKFLATFLLTDPLIKQAPFLADLARAEWEIAGAFHHAFLPAVAMNVLQYFREEDWQKVRFEFQPSLALLFSSWPLPALLHVQDMQEEEFDADAVGKQSAAYLLIAQRADQGVDWHSIDEKEFCVLQALRNGKSLGEVCERNLAPEDAPLVQQWFANWMANGLITRIY